MKGTIPAKKKSRYLATEESPPPKRLPESANRERQRHMANEFSKALRQLMPEPKIEEPKDD